MEKEMSFICFNKLLNFAITNGNPYFPNEFKNAVGAIIKKNIKNPEYHQYGKFNCENQLRTYCHD
jgi:hypothetical protein